jgi:hypothetical protein
MAAAMPDTPAPMMMLHSDWPKVEKKSGEFHVGNIRLKLNACC